MKQDLSCDLTEGEIIDPTTIRELISSTTYLAPNLEKKTSHRGSTEKIKKSYIPIDFTIWDQCLVTSVEKQTHIQSHSHDEPLFRYVLEGSFRINGILHKAGDWVLLPQNFVYEIDTEDGYKTISHYYTICVVEH
ncbi:MAG: hypothetical protein JWR51_3846 [Devosia sp.]|nr:hypothetical protein [Devosia sp.]